MKINENTCWQCITLCYYYIMKVKQTITIDVGRLKEIKLLAIKLDMKFSEAIENAIQEYLDKHT